MENLRKRILLKKGFYGGAGYLSSVTVGALGYIGVPIAAAGMGGWLSYKRANEEVRKKEILGEREKVLRDKKQDSQKFRESGQLATNFDRLMSRIKRREAESLFLMRLK